MLLFELAKIFGRLGETRKDRIVPSSIGCGSCIFFRLLILSWLTGPPDSRSVRVANFLDCKLWLAIGKFAGSKNYTILAVREILSRFFDFWLKNVCCKKDSARVPLRKCPRFVSKTQARPTVTYKLPEAAEKAEAAKSFQTENFNLPSEVRAIRTLLSFARKFCRLFDRE